MQTQGQQKGVEEELLSSSQQRSQKPDAALLPQPSLEKQPSGMRSCSQFLFFVSKYLRLLLLGDLGCDDHVLELTQGSSTCFLPPARGPAGLSGGASLPAARGLVGFSLENINGIAMNLSQTAQFSEASKI